jgi:hypothetical protein
MLSLDPHDWKDCLLLCSKPNLRWMEGVFLFQFLDGSLASPYWFAWKLEPLAYANQGEKGESRQDKPKEESSNKRENEKWKGEEEGDDYKYNISPNRPGHNALFV